MKIKEAANDQEAKLFRAEIDKIESEFAKTPFNSKGVRS